MRRFSIAPEPDRCFVAAGIWHPDNRALTRVRTAIAHDMEQWARVRKKLILEGDNYRGRRVDWIPAHPFIDDLKMKEFVTWVPLSRSKSAAPN